MTYVVCVNQPGYLPEADPVTVDTLEDARALAAEEVGRSFDGQPPLTLLGLAWELPVGGAVIGPLPDGYVIDVTEQ